MKKPQFLINEIYHIYNRGVEKRKIFLENRDRFRFVHDLFEFNDENPVSNVKYYFNPKNMEVEPPYIPKRKPRKLLVEILAFSLMPNHYHLLLRQKKNGGIIKFMHKLNTGYTMYFNQEYERVGSLFQGRFKAIHVNKEEYLVYLLYYIHLNSLELVESGLKRRKLKNYKNAIKFLNSYRWSSHLDYVNKKNFSSLTQKDFILNVLGGWKNYKENIIRYVNEIAGKTKSREFKILTME